MRSQNQTSQGSLNGLSSTLVPSLNLSSTHRLGSASSTRHSASTRSLHDRETRKNAKYTARLLKEVDIHHLLSPKALRPIAELGYRKPQLGFEKLVSKFRDDSFEEVNSARRKGRHRAVNFEKEQEEKRLGPTNQFQRKLRMTQKNIRHNTGNHKTSNKRHHNKHDIRIEKTVGFPHEGSIPDDDSNASKDDIFEFNDRKKGFLLNLFLKEKLSDIMKEKEWEFEFRNMMDTTSTFNNETSDSYHQHHPRRGSLWQTGGPHHSSRGGHTTVNPDSPLASFVSNHRTAPPKILSTSQGLATYRQFALENGLPREAKIDRVLFQKHQRENEMTTYRFKQMSKLGQTLKHFQTKGSRRTSRSSSLSAASDDSIREKMKRSTKKKKTQILDPFERGLRRSKTIVMDTLVRSRIDDQLNRIDLLDYDEFFSDELKELLNPLIPQLSWNAIPFETNKFDEFFSTGGSSDVIQSKGKTYRIGFRGLWTQDGEPRGKIPATREGATGVVHREYLYMFGGKSRDRFNDLKMFDLERGVWMDIEQEGRPPKPRFGHSCSFYRNELIVFGGGGQFNQITKKRDCFNDIKCFSLTQYTWVRPKCLGPIPEKRVYHASTILEDHMVIHGGSQGDSFTMFNNLFVLNLEDMVWISPTESKTDGSHPGCRTGHTLISYVSPFMERSNISGVWEMTKARYMTEVNRGELAYCMLMFGGMTENRKCQNDLYLLRPGLRAHPNDKLVMEYSKPATHGRPPSERYLHSAVVYEDHMFIFGGRNEENYLSTGSIAINDIVAFNIQKFEWETVASYGSHPEGRWGQIFCKYKQSLIMLGGVNASSYCGSSLCRFHLDEQVIGNQLAKYKQVFQKGLKDEVAKHKKNKNRLFKVMSNLLNDAAPQLKKIKRMKTRGNALSPDHAKFNPFAKLKK